MTSTNISDDGVGQLAQAASALSEAHSRRPPAQLLAEVAGLHRQIQALLRGGRQRLGQTRELYRIDADLLAHAALHFTPERWLHATVLIVGLSDGIAAASIDTMIDQARQRLGLVPPVTVSLGRVLYHPEASTLGMQPADALDAVVGAVRMLTRAPRAGQQTPRRRAGRRTSRSPTAPPSSQPARSSPPSDASCPSARSPSAASALLRSMEQSASGTGAR
jgi:hypothetical protein